MAWVRELGGQRRVGEVLKSGQVVSKEVRRLAFELEIVAETRTEHLMLLPEEGALVEV